MKPFKDRRDAGQRLAMELSSRKWYNACIVTIPRGGVPVAVEIARHWRLPWDIIVIKKIGYPLLPEFAIGAVGVDNIPIWNPEALDYLPTDSQTLKSMSDLAVSKAIEKSCSWNPFRTPLAIKDQNIILVDDGSNTGLTLRAAIESLQWRGAAQISVAIPVASSSAIESISKLVKEIIVLKVPPYFRTVGEWYDDFTPVSEETVTSLLPQARGQTSQISSVEKGANR